MLEPRDTDIPALFLVLVVLPLITYILLGKWSEASKKKERISFLAQLAAEEALKAETMAAASVIPLVPLPKNGIHECARCYGPATTRCSRCKSVRYCSGKCQILHWREVHKQECQQLENNNNNLSPLPASNEELVSGILDGNNDSQWLLYKNKQPRHDRSPSEDAINTPNSRFVSTCKKLDTLEDPMMERKSIDNQVSCKPNREISRRDDEAMQESSEEASMGGATGSTSSNFTGSKESHMRHKRKEGDSVRLEKDTAEKHNVRFSHEHTSRGSMHESRILQSQNEFTHDSGNSFGFSDSLNKSKYGKAACGFETDGEKFFMEGVTSTEKPVQLNYSSESSKRRSSKVKSPSDYMRSKTCKSPKSSRAHLCSDMERKEVVRIRDSCHAHGSIGVSGMGIMRMIGIKKTPKGGRREHSGLNGNRHRKIKMLFPYDEFVRFFQYEVLDLSPRGLINCGNSCYANAVLQCLTSTRPLTLYLLCRSHSKACCMKNWCLICELEQHVMMLRESGDPLSPSRILLHMRRINCQIGDGSQEDAHEFLRLLVTSMQSICLENLGGENVVDPRLQETTFIQHTFGGRLRSKVKCLRCHHESERYENIMDLTLEIYGWVETLEDALTQFTSVEDLDGDNMYRCGRCAAYVRARKQLSIEEAPNILTIVLKRFQEGSYGKINKYITFPDMLDMIPFMTGTDDIPPLYILYAVVVHLDNFNASFSGHYVSYVKDPQGNWFRIDDTKVQPVPLSQVMSEGAYILFYTRSSPRPVEACNGKPIWHQAPGISKQWASKSHQSSRQGQSKFSCQDVGPESSLHRKEQTAMGSADPTINGIHRNANRNGQPVIETCAQSMNLEFSDVTSSDWSIFSSSDEASFTTESTRDSFSTVDYADGCSIDPITSIFNTSYAPDYLSSRKHGSCSTSTQPLDRIWKTGNLKQVSKTLAGGFHCGSNFGLHVNCGSSSETVPCRTGQCIL